MKPFLASTFGGNSHESCRFTAKNEVQLTDLPDPTRGADEVVVEVGQSVSNISTGDRVVVDPNLECGTCRACKRGWAHLCENLGAYGVTTHGGFAELSVVKATAVHPIGDMSFL